MGGLEGVGPTASTPNGADMAFGDTGVASIGSARDSGGLLGVLLVRSGSLLGIVHRPHVTTGRRPFPRLLFVPDSFRPLNLLL